MTHLHREGPGNLTREQLVALVDSGDECTDSELAAMRFTYKLGTDHLSIDTDDIAALHAHFAEPQIVEIGQLAVVAGSLVQNHSGSR